MKKELKKIHLAGFTTKSGAYYPILPLSYQVFGKPLGTAPVILVNHALTGNSQVTGATGWWNAIVGNGKVIDTNVFSVIAFNIPGNGYDGFYIKNYQDFVAADTARIFIRGLNYLKIKKLYAIIGGSVGGGIAWEMLAQAPDLTRFLIPIASDWKSTDWLIANCAVQEQILNNSKNPVHDARMHAMLCYRSPESLKHKFHRGKTSESRYFDVEKWLFHHGKKLDDRFRLPAYKLMNQLLKTINATSGVQTIEEVVTRSKAHIYIIAIDSDVFFTAYENKDTWRLLRQNSETVFYNEIRSIHGHDAFLIEHQQVTQLLEPIFKPLEKTHEN
ncbi:alpha/beta fold hydrolase [Ascidiimonas aurantiaca]|uniref:alpha/beta fold hydrolase n=1 Tax=Ascidiimonas aurantiaca TaxID=1685432 RepID=UPI0030EEE494